MNKETRTFVFYFILMVICALSAGADVIKITKLMDLWKRVILNYLNFGRNRNE
jgi:hypothetical protein